MREWIYLPFRVGDRELSLRITRMIWGRYHVLLALGLAVLPGLLSYLADYILLRLALSGGRFAAVAMNSWVFVTNSSWPAYLGFLGICIVLSLRIRKFLASGIYRDQLLLVPGGRQIVLTMITRQLCVLALVTYAMSLGIPSIMQLNLRADDESAGIIGSLSSSRYGLLSMLIPRGEAGGPVPTLFWACCYDFYIHFGCITAFLARFLLGTLVIVAALRSNGWWQGALIVASLYAAIQYGCFLLVSLAFEHFPRELIQALPYGPGPLIHFAVHLSALLSTLYWWHRKVRFGLLDIESHE